MATPPNGESATAAPSAAQATGSSVTSGTSSTFSSSSTSTNAPYLTPDIPSDWWHSIENANLATTSFVLTNLYKPALGGNLKLQNYVEFVYEYMEQYCQHWQFYAIIPKHADSSIVLSSPRRRHRFIPTSCEDTGTGDAVGA